ncbi:aromatic acid exporter family protein [Ornithinibacillus halophilus]|uniref:Uncharacterized membrane protein YgaE, UPF0421/DUF939 family n=1 Tax=Ornithinibacillus halophilus TaxID=930117 RepID=A0A1M5CX14_9BACI|nr:aromatic acid exporter family protein [Ornithinibacillus halophilus]SHF59022.1 Uncharacterized membrane protein YgaE, UPF0421/DUF939 family [Ornithinibacillus halophilus]
MKIGYRTIKTAIGTPISVWIAQAFGISNFVSAGILTILCIKPSRKQSVSSAWDRFAACIIASIFSMVFFEIIGYYPIVIGLMLAVFIPVTVWLKITDGIATSSVVILNLYGAKQVTLAYMLDQYLLIIIGIGVGLVVNLYMPSYDKKLRETQKKLEANYQIILSEIAKYIRDNDRLWDGKEITETEEILERASDLVALDRENHLLRSKHPYYQYFKMRSKQYEQLKKMLPLVTRLPKTDYISMQIADYFDRLSNAVHPGNTAVLFIEELKVLRDEFHKQELPKTREEFETRANLFRLLEEIEDYLEIKKKFKKSDVSKKRAGARS